MVSLTLQPFNEKESLFRPHADLKITSQFTNCSCPSRIDSIYREWGLVIGASTTSVGISDGVSRPGLGIKKFYWTIFASLGLEGFRSRLALDLEGCRSCCICKQKTTKTGRINGVNLKKFSWHFWKHFGKIHTFSSPETRSRISSLDFWSRNL